MTAISDRQKVMYAILASLFVHLAIGLILALWTGINEVERALPALSQLTVTIMPAKPVSAAKPVTAASRTPPPRAANMPKPVLDSDGLTRAAKAPPEALFQSDANMVAGSQLPATGDAALPSQAGPRRNFADFTNQAAAFGKGQAPAPPRVQPKPAQAAQTAQSMPEQTPSAVTQVEHTPTPVPTPIPTPKPAPTAAADTLALGKPTPKPAATLPSPVTELAKLTSPPSLRGHADMAPVNHLPAPPQSAAPSQPSAPGMQRELEKTRVDGGITKPGAPGVDAVETPFGRYHRKLSNLIGSRWKLYLQEHPKDVGDVTILVRLDTNGKVAGTRVVANHSMDDLADLSTRAIMESDLPPVPDDLAPMLRDGKLEISFNFNVYDASNDSPGR